MKVDILIGTRPNFIKVIQFKKFTKECFTNIELNVIQMGKHYNKNLAEIFFSRFGLQPDLLDLINKIKSCDYKPRKIPKKWDRNVIYRIHESINNHL